MPYTPLRISIPEPCHEDWQGMHAVPNTSARHCGSCAKNVTDFTGMTDAQMNAYIRANGGKLCGRFRPDQLGRPLRAASSPGRSGNPLKVAATAAGLMLASASMDGQQVEKPLPPRPEVKIESRLSEEISTYSPAVLKDSLQPPPVARPAIVGLIAIPPPPPPPPASEVDTLAEEWLMGDVELAATDSEPPPEVEVPGIENCTSAVDPGSLAAPIPVISSGPGTPTSVPDSLPGNAEFPRHHPGGMLMGLVAVDRFPKPTGMDWVRDTIKNILVPTVPSEDLPRHPRPRPDELPPYLENLTVSPNPFVDHLRLALDLPAKQALTVELLDPNGRLVHAETWQAPAGKSSITLQPKQRKLTHAIYYLRVTDAKGYSVVKTVVR